MDKSTYSAAEDHFTVPESPVQEIYPRCRYAAHVV